MLMIDRYMPEYQFGEYHEIVIRAPREEVFRAVCELRGEDIPFMRILFAIRLLPSFVLGKRKWEGRRLAPAESPAFLKSMVHYGFLVLEERPAEELVLGVAGEFWKLAGNAPFKLDSPERFLNFHNPKAVKSVMQFLLRDQPSGTTLLCTETRVSAVDSAARLKFGLYWACIYPFSALIRRMMLKSIKKIAERRVRHD
ncbi:hypothetical protein ACFQZE_13620 [Paenibacillus sp. GCM10027627]|uniref:hypothetical protein n=1 Tax=unclassified Paenibacillus TaxID=185978 RepID=UPI0036443D61